MEDRASVPLILVCSAQNIESLRMHFSENDYFGFESEKVCTASSHEEPLYNYDIVLWHGMVLKQF